VIRRPLTCATGPDGQTASFDLDTILCNHHGAFMLGGAHFSSSASEVRLRGSILYATLASSHGKGQKRDAAIDLEACGIVRAEGLVAPSALTDPALNTVNTHAVRTALVDGRRSKLALMVTGKTDLTAPWTEINILEALTLHGLAKIERTLISLLEVDAHLGCTLPRLLPGLLDGDKGKGAADAGVDARTGFVRNYARYLREVPSVRPRDWASVFEASWRIVADLLRASRRTAGIAPPLEVFALLHEAERHLARAVALRRTAVKLDREERRKRRRTRFGKRIEVVVEMIERSLLPSTPPGSPLRCDEMERDEIEPVGDGKDPFADV
jgi:hypothetical protein